METPEGSEERFKKNVDRWALFNAGDAAKLATLTCTSTQLVSGNIKITPSGKQFFSIQKKTP